MHLKFEDRNPGGGAPAHDVRLRPHLSGLLRRLLKPTETQLLAGCWARTRTSAGPGPPAWTRGSNDEKRSQKLGTILLMRLQQLSGGLCVLQNRIRPRCWWTHLLVLAGIHSSQTLVRQRLVLQVSRKQLWTSSSTWAEP